MQPPSSPSKALLVAVVVVWTTGCPARRIDFGSTGQLDDPGAVLAAVETRERQLHSVKGQGKLSISSPQGSGTLDVFVAAARPGSLHIESLDFFGRPQAVLVSDGTRFGLFDVANGTYYTGPASPQNLARFLQAALPPDHLVGILLGAAPRLDVPDPKLRLDEKAQAYALTLQDAETLQTLWVDPIRLRVTRSDRQGANAYGLAFSDFEEANIVFPKAVGLQIPSAKVELKLRYTEATFNGSPEPELFDPTPPEDIPVVELDAEGNPLPPGA